ncbi:insulin-like growth factor I [Myzus persicae]|uniref:insulin-like growth factor I n=1 Tax=Myzus persicae TaxID=13164 RepID=UPI000B936269|nr:insulin-like growth factor I [Myzus persicae]
MMIVIRTSIMVKLSMVLLVFCLVGLSRAVVIRQPNLYWDNIDKYCGSRLADELRVICRGKYNEVPAGQPELSIGARRRLGLSMVVDECCTLPCNRRTLKTYCASVP